MTRIRRTATDTFRSLHTRNFRLFFTGQMISQIGNWLTLIAQSLLVYHLTDSGTAVGVTTAFQFAPVLLLGPWAGLVADRSDKRKLLIIVQTIAMGQSFVLAALAFSGSPPVAAIYAVALIGGVTVAFDNPARRAFVVEMVSAEDMPNAVSLNSTLMTGSRIVGPVLAGALISTVGYGWCFLVDGLSYIAVLVCLQRMRTSELRAAPVTPKGKGQVRAGLNYVRSQPVLFVPMAMMAVVGTLSYNFQTVFPLFTSRDFGGDASTYTTLFGVVSVGALVGALVAANRTKVTVRTVGWASVGYGVAMAAMSVVPSLAVAYLVALPLGFASITFLTASTAIVQVESAPEMRGRVLALQAMLFLGTTPIGGPILGALCDHFGARSGIVVGAIAALGAGAWGVVRANHQADPAVDPESVGPIEVTMPGTADVEGRVTPGPVAA